MGCLPSKSKDSKPPHPQNANGTGGATVIVETSPKTSPRIPASVTDNSSNNRTALNVFKFTLGALSTASEGVPIPGVKLAIESLLTITNHIQQRSVNESGFLDLSERIQRLDPILSQIGKKGGTEAVMPLLQDLERELVNLTAEINLASSQGQFSRLFNSRDDAGSLVNHIATLDHIIADFTLAMTSNTYQALVNVQGGIKEIQGDVKLLQVTKGTKKFGNLKAGIGGTGGKGDERGGAGGHGGSFKMKMATETAYEFGDVEVGAGGSGGDSKGVGGQAGSGGKVEIIEE